MPGQLTQDRQGEHEPGDAAEAFVDHGVERQRQRDDSADHEEPAQRHDRRSDCAVQRRRSLEPVREVEHADGLHQDDRRRHQHGARQQRAWISGRAPQHRREHEPDRHVQTNATRKDEPATAIPNSARARLTSTVVRPDADDEADDGADDLRARLDPTGSRHARQLAPISTLLNDRPAVTIPTKPSSTAIQRVELGWARALRSGRQLTLNTGGVVHLVRLATARR